MPSHLTLAEFLAWEDTREERHEFVDGEIFAMAGASRPHNTIALNLAFILRPQLRPRGCQTFVEGVKLIAGEDSFYPGVIRLADLYVDVLIPA